MAARRLQALIVEDDPRVRDLLERELRDAGLAVRAVADAPAALAAAADDPPDVIVADIRLPGGADGVALCGALRARHPDAAVVLTTAFASVETAIEGVRVGAEDYLVKPFEDLDAVRRTVVRSAEAARRRAGERAAAERLRARAEQEALLLDSLPVSILLVDEERRVDAQNSAARRLLQRADALRVGADGRLHATSRRADEALGAAVAACFGDPPAAPVALTCWDGDRDPPHALVVPLVAEGDGGRLAAVLVDERGHPSVRPDHSLLSHLYGLTPGEAALLAQLVEGATLTQACRALGIALSTGRTHLAHVFAKTATRRQADLVARVLSGPLLVAAGLDGRPRRCRVARPDGGGAHTPGGA